MGAAEHPGADGEVDFEIVDFEQAHDGRRVNGVEFKVQKLNAVMGRGTLPPESPESRIHEKFMICRDEPEL
jgi:hypothetical protein